MYAWQYIAYYTSCIISQQYHCLLLHSRGVISSVVKPLSNMKSYGPFPSTYTCIITYSRPNPPFGKRSLLIGKSATGLSSSAAFALEDFLSPPKKNGNDGNAAKDANVLRRPTSGRSGASWSDLDFLAARKELFFE